MIQIIFYIFNGVYILTYGVYDVTLNTIKQNLDSEINSSRFT